MRKYEIVAKHGAKLFDLGEKVSKLEDQVSSIKEENKLLRREIKLIDSKVNDCISLNIKAKCKYCGGDIRVVSVSSHDDPYEIYVHNYYKAICTKCSLAIVTRGYVSIEELVNFLTDGIRE